jgi:hypothetical protein
MPATVNGDHRAQRPLLSGDPSGVCRPSALPKHAQEPRQFAYPASAIQDPPMLHSNAPKTPEKPDLLHLSEKSYCLYGAL